MLTTIGGSLAESVRIFRPSLAVLLFVMALIPTITSAQTQQSKPAGANPVPEPAVSTILAAFDKYQVVAMPEAHGMKDLDDFILTLIRTPNFSDKVDDIEVECGNSLYQPVLDRYIAGEDVEFTEARKAWRNTTQPMCDGSGFFEQLFPLVRAINQKLPAEKRLRVLAGNPPIDWDQIMTPEHVPDVITLRRVGMPRDDHIAAVMEKEVLSKNRRALMLFGTFHIFHGFEIGAIGKYEKHYPNVTFVISELGGFDTDQPTLTSSTFASWPMPSVARAKGTWLGALELIHFFPVFVLGEGCTVDELFQRPMEQLVDAFLYLGPQDLRLKEQVPADMALDAEYRAEGQRRATLMAFPGELVRTTQEIDRRIVDSAINPLFISPKQPDLKAMVQSCLDRKNSSNTPQ